MPTKKQVEDVYKKMADKVPVPLRTKELEKRIYDCMQADLEKAE